MLPPAFGIWVLGWLGLRAVAEGAGLVGVMSGLVLAGLGIWVLRGWVQILELHRLAETMALDLSDENAARLARHRADLQAALARRGERWLDPGLLRAWFVDGRRP